MAGSVRAEVIAVLAGIDDYEHVTSLDGAVADAEDLASAFGWLGARTDLLVDRAVDRESLIRALDQAVAAAGPDDVVVFAFAGHGIQVPDQDGDEADGFDEAFVLPDFRPGVQDRSNLILDDEIARFVQRAAPATVVLLADSCHSGTMLRSVDARADFRKVRSLPRASFGIQRSSVAFDRRLSASDMSGNLLFFGAVPEHLGVQEVLIDGRPRGALSYAFARAVQGVGDHDQDGVVTDEELRVQVPELVRVLSEGRQTPQAIAAQGSRGALFHLPAEPGPRPGPPDADVPQGALLQAGPADAFLRVAVQGGSGWQASGLERLRGVQVVPRPELADLILDQPTGDILTSAGDVAARLGPARGTALIQGIIDKWRLIEGIESAVDGRIEARVHPADAVFPSGAPFALRIVSHTSGHLVLFDLASDGTVLMISPRAGQQPARLSVGETFELQLRAGPPFGADHLVVALVPAERVQEVTGLLHDVHGRPLSLEQANRLKHVLAEAAALPIAVYTEP